MAVDFSPSGLATAAGVDPWSLAQQVLSGDPGALQNGALCIRRAGRLAAEAADAGHRADRVLAAGFSNDGAAVFDSAASTRQGARLLADRGERIEEAARAVLDVAAVLSDTRTSTGSRIAALDAELARIINLRNGVRVTGPDQAAVAAGLAAADQRYFGMAVDAVHGAGTGVRSDLDDYEAVLVSRTARLAGLGYTRPPEAGRPDGAPISAAIGLGSVVLDPLGDALSALGQAALDNPEAVVGFLAGLGVALAGSALVASGVGVTVGTGGLATPVGGGAAAGGWALFGIGGALMAASAGEIGRDAADKINQTHAAGSSGPVPAHTQPTHLPDPTAEPRGEPARAKPLDNLEKQRALDRQNESLSILAKAGYDVEQLPEGDAAGVKNPDSRIEGRIFDVYAPSSERPRNIASQIGGKVDEGQADRVVLNLADTPVDVEQMRDQLHSWPEPGLKEVIVIDSQGNISHLYP